jgi:CheY-like chemotaxis protein
MKTVNVLLVEDNEADVLLTGEILYQAGVENEIMVARDGSEAIDFIAKRNKFSNAITPDLVLLDINLPKTDGKDVLYFIKNNVPGKTIPVIMYTSSTLESDKLFCYENNADLYLNKPSLIEDFDKVIIAIKEFITKISL